ncbi:MAG TPA: twin-arginine translocase subunit TatC [Bryobacteraceae bacterium]|nr:twin-arginine translocase subunit TatC [Bryobacteraceae bacterium]
MDDQHPDIYPDDPYGGVSNQPGQKETVSDESPYDKVMARLSQGGKKPPSSGGSGGGEGGDEEEGMLRMSFLDHLGELRSRIIRALVGFGVVFFVCLVFSNELWLIVQAPAVEAFKNLKTGSLVGIDPMEQFSIIWMWTPLVASIFVASPWILYQIWAFIAPGLYKKERRWAVPFILTTAGLFITGGFFAYFIAFRYGLTFLLGLGKFGGVVPMISIDKYFELFVDVMLGVSAIFEMPVIIFFLIVLRLATPKFLMEHSRYAILAIVIIAAIITPTPDVFNLMLFAVPMCLLFFVGVFAGYLLVLHRDKQRFPWGKVMPYVITLLVVGGIVVWIMVARYHYHLVKHWPFLIK